jgi:hypothetical protein
VKSLPIVYKIGCWSFILVGIGHLITSMDIPDTPERTKIIQEMKSFSISMSGTESNLSLFHDGFSLMMGVLLIGYGLINLSLANASMIPRKQIILINVVVSLVSVVISIKYFFIVPVAFLCMAALCFSMVFILSAKSINYS